MKMILAAASVLVSTSAFAGTIYRCASHNADKTMVFVDVTSRTAALKIGPSFENFASSDSTFARKQAPTPYTWTFESESLANTGTVINFDPKALSASVYKYDLLKLMSTTTGPLSCILVNSL